MKTLCRPVLDGAREAMKNDTAPGVVEICTEIDTNLEILGNKWDPGKQISMRAQREGDRLFRPGE